MITARVEDEADKWLREHDPFYTDKSRNKKDKYSSYYETPEMEKRRLQVEIPLSSLSMTQAKSIGLAICGDEGKWEYEL